MNRNYSPTLSQRTPSIEMLLYGQGSERTVPALETELQHNLLIKHHMWNFSAEDTVRCSPSKSPSPIAATTGMYGRGTRAMYAFRVRTHRSLPGPCSDAMSSASEKRSACSMRMRGHGQGDGATLAKEHSVTKVPF